MVPKIGRADLEPPPADISTLPWTRAVCAALDALMSSQPEPPPPPPPPEPEKVSAPEPASSGVTNASGNGPSQSSTPLEPAAMARVDLEELLELKVEAAPAAHTGVSPYLLVMAAATVLIGALVIARAKR